MDYVLQCTKCSRRAKDESQFRCGSCNSILEVKYDYSKLDLPKKFRGKKASNKKYLPFLPVKALSAGLGEGGTPLVRKHFGDLGGVSLLMKLETLNPTRSFKDRGSAVEITKAADLGFSEVACASTGNMGMSIAYYARKAGIKSTIFISSGANKSKIAMIKKYGAKVVKVNGDFNYALKMSEKFALSKPVFLCGDYHYRKEGQKTVIFEILDQLGTTPDFIFLPVGNATLLSAAYKGLAEYKMLGWIRRLPKIVAVQSSACAPFVKAYNRKEKIGYIRPKTIADAIAVGYPTFGDQGISAIKKTKGFAISVPDSAIASAARFLYKNGV
ncbi:MAG: pyridoxal-phosphate dependent enzyme, partial [Candidatus Micrarchaeaceae archaeon]